MSEIEEQYKKNALDIKRMVLALEDPLDGFNRRNYASKFEDFCKKHEAELDGLTAVYDAQQADTTVFETVGACYAQEMSNELQKESKKSKQEMLLMQYNMSMVSFVFPAIRHREDTYKSAADAFTEVLTQTWKAQFPKTNLKAVDLTEIEAGFKKRHCYITTAVCETLGKDDSCYELQSLRAFRDNYLLTTEEGEQAVHTYYDLAPTIVKNINKLDKADEIYQTIYQQYLTPCLQLIEEKKPEACSNLYQEMVYTLKDKYFITKHA